MAATTAHKRRPRKSAADAATRAAILLKSDALDQLFTEAGITTYQAKAQALGGSSVGALHRAYNGGSVSAALICAVRLRFPTVPYEQLFTEGEVPANAPADAAA